MLEGHKNPGSIEAEVLMMRTVSNATVLLLEGPHDARFWRARVSAGGCTLIACGGKNNVIGAIAKLEARCVPGALGIVDKDFDELLCKGVGSLNLVSTDDHDLECMLIKAISSWEGMLSECGDAEKIRQFEVATGKKVRVHVVERGIAFGRWRFAAAKMDGEIRTQRLQVSDYLKADSWNVNVDDLAASATEGLERREAEVLSELAHSADGLDSWQVCVGHDLLAILRIGLQSVLGKLPERLVPQIAAVLRAGFSSADMRTTAMYASIRAWEERNGPYRVFAERVHG